MVANLARAWSARIIEPIARFLGSLGLTPNAVTVLGFLLTVAVAGVLATGRLFLAGILLIVTLAFDAVDGTLARLLGQTSKFGAFLDSTLDRWAEVVMYVAITWVMLQADNDLGAMLAVLALSMSLLVSYTRARAEGVGLQCKEGIFTRFERLVVLIAGLLVGQLTWALGIIAVLAGITAIQRILVTWRATNSA
ncbi:MAG: CDP-alcohol phosphatidyltransferase family protein [Anaerolineae bacterium]|jgi:CDP-diacylglycerol--glycerol-3-phosphate 3-phosphatidyltransferase|nr:CDP-alcohol phosphatidyltransferase family protein [Anaerolineae bacterium]